MLINLWDKLTHLSVVITLESVDHLKDELGGIFTVKKMHHYMQGQSTAICPVQCPKQSIGLSLAALLGHMQSQWTPGHTPKQYLPLAMQLRNPSSLWPSTKCWYRITLTTYKSKKQARG